MAKLPRPVIALGIVSLLTDASSEMIYPLLPVFLAALGAGPQYIGLIEGIAETTSSLLKLVSGKLSDRWGKRKAFVVAGYGISSLARPLVGLAMTPLQVMGVRFTDRVGKGLRSSPRDALISAAIEPANRGRAFGFHRAMDHAGAVVGPLLAAAAFYFLGSDQSNLDAMRTVFLLASVPAAAAVIVLVVMVKEKAAEPVVASAPRARLSRRMKAYLFAVFFLGLSLSSDAFLLLRARDLGVSAVAIPLLWSFHHVIKVLASTPGGALSDRIGRRATLVYGYFIYIAVYVLFAFATEAWHAWALMALYGGYFGLAEGTEKALVADLAGPHETGTAFGAFHLVSGLAALPASLFFGFVWSKGGAQSAFLVGALMAAVGVTLLHLVLRGATARTA